VDRFAGVRAHHHTVDTDLGDVRDRGAGREFNGRGRRVVALQLPGGVDMVGQVDGLAAGETYAERGTDP
jgi:hypothetical protein